MAPYAVYCENETRIQQIRRIVNAVQLTIILLSRIQARRRALKLCSFLPLGYWWFNAIKDLTIGNLYVTIWHNFGNFIVTMRLAKFLEKGED